MSTTPSSYFPDKALRCPRCNLPMEMVLRSGRNKQTGRYFVCSTLRCPVTRAWKFDAPLCPWCVRRMRVHVGKQQQWKGVAVWWCETHRFHQNHHLHRNRSLGKSRLPQRSPEEESFMLPTETSRSATARLPRLDVQVEGQLGLEGSSPSRPIAKPLISRFFSGDRKGASKPVPPTHLLDFKTSAVLR